MRGEGNYRPSGYGQRPRGGGQRGGGGGGRGRGHFDSPRGRGKVRGGRGAGSGGNRGYDRDDQHYGGPQRKPGPRYFESDTRGLGGGGGRGRRDRSRSPLLPIRYDDRRGSGGGGRGRGRGHRGYDDRPRGRGGRGRGGVRRRDSPPSMSPSDWPSGGRRSRSPLTTKYYDDNTPIPHHLDEERGDRGPSGPRQSTSRQRSPPSSHYASSSRSHVEHSDEGDRRSPGRRILQQGRHPIRTKRSRDRDDSHDFFDQDVDEGYSKQKRMDGYRSASREAHRHGRHEEYMDEGGDRMNSSHSERRSRQSEERDYDFHERHHSRGRVRGRGKRGRERGGGNYRGRERHFDQRDVASSSYEGSDDYYHEEQERPSALDRLGRRMTVTERLGVKEDCHEEEEDDNDEHGGDNSRSRLLSEDDGDQSHVRLRCPMCVTDNGLPYEAKTFREYLFHLDTYDHHNELRREKYRLSTKLAKMRGEQRKLQREIEDKLGEDKLQAETSYCKKCKLAFKQTVGEHEETDLHKDIVAFVDPSCAVCGMNFFSPMAYSKHKASLGHLKKYYEVNPDEANREVSTASQSKEDDGEDEDGIPANLDEFVTVDEVGDVDDDEGEEVQKQTMRQEKDENRKEDPEPSQVKEKSVKGEAQPKFKAPSQVKIKVEKEVDRFDSSRAMGTSFVRKVFMFYCKLCHKYLTRQGVQEGDREQEELMRAAANDHCKSRAHQTALFKREEEQQVVVKQEQEPDLGENGESDKNKETEEREEEAEKEDTTEVETSQETQEMREEEEEEEEEMEVHLAESGGDFAEEDEHGEEEEEEVEEVEVTNQEEENNGQ